MRSTRTSTRLLVKMPSSSSQGPSMCPCIERLSPGPQLKCAMNMGLETVQQPLLMASMAMKRKIFTRSCKQSKFVPSPVLDTRALNLPSFITPTSRVSLSVLFCLRTNASASSMCASTHSRIRRNLKIGQLPETGSHSSMLPLAM